MQPTDAIGQFLAAQAARLNAEAEAASVGTGYSRRINGSRWVANLDGTMTHLRVTREATNDEEEWCRRRDPLRGLNAESIKAHEQLYHEAGPGDIEAKLEDRDYYKEVNAFWVPESARWEALRAAAKQPDIGKRIDDALTQIEQENPKLKDILDKRYARAQLPDGKLGELVDLVSTIGFGDNPALPVTSWGRYTSTSWACSPVLKASVVVSSTPPQVSSRRWWPSSTRTVVRCTTLAAGLAACLFKVRSSSKPMAARLAMCPSTDKRPTPPLGGWRP
jgi:hypothetical protein